MLIAEKGIRYRLSIKVTTFATVLNCYKFAPKENTKKAKSPLFNNLEVVIRK